ncbi:MAG: glycosyltransferase family 2 protein [Treponema sp.]|nr:glycosyltransferase family 2 protein [Treponema sp.]
MKKKKPLISVCIPLYETEHFLAQCLYSVAVQDFDDFEVVIVSDASRGRDEKGRSAKKIVRLVQKEGNRLRKKQGLSPVDFRFIEHSENRGLIEVRRTLCFQARAAYMTQLDSDDQMEEGALSALYNTALLGDYDIVHGTSRAGTFLSDNSFVPAKENRYGKIFYGEIYGREVFRRWLIDGAFTANTWGKLIKRELWLQAFENIPYTECNMADDVLLFFFLSQYAKSYRGIEARVYRYRVNSGMSSGRKIDSLHKWKMICTAASVFTVISQWCEAHKTEIQPDELNYLRKMTSYYLGNNINQMHETVIPELQPAAREMLCEYWGESFVEHMETAMKNKA